MPPAAPAALRLPLARLLSPLPASRRERVDHSLPGSQAHTQHTTLLSKLPGFRFPLTQLRPQRYELRFLLRSLRRGRCRRLLSLCAHRFAASRCSACLLSRCPQRQQLRRDLPPDCLHCIRLLATQLTPKQPYFCVELSQLLLLHLRRHLYPGTCWRTRASPSTTPLSRAPPTLAGCSWCYCCGLPPSPSSSLLSPDWYSCGKCVSASGLIGYPCTANSPSTLFAHPWKRSLWKPGLSSGST